MKNIISERIRRLDSLLSNKQANLQRDEHYVNSPLTQEHINDLRRDIYLQKLKLQKSLGHHAVEPKELFVAVKEELEKIEKQIGALKVV